jgi:pyruvate-formate lyase-activating enzyme
VEVEKVFFMGGEPSIDPELPIVAEEIHTEFCAYNVLLTNGFFLPSLTDIDEVCLSVKAYTPELHRDFTGKSNRKVLENFVSLYNSHVRLRSESILIPHYIDHQEIENIARFIASVDQKIPYRIDAYTPVPSSPWRSPTKGEVERAVDAARKYLCNVSCLKGDEILKYKVLRIV